MTLTIRWTGLVSDAAWTELRAQTSERGRPGVSQVISGRICAAQAPTLTGRLRVISEQTLVPCIVRPALAAKAVCGRVAMIGPWSPQPSLQQHHHGRLESHG